VLNIDADSEPVAGPHTACFGVGVHLYGDLRPRVEVLAGPLNQCGEVLLPMSPLGAGIIERDRRATPP
jgi:hypothetical protein